MPIYLRLTIDGERTEFSTQREIDPTKWNSKAGRAIATKKEEMRLLSSFLETIQAQIYEAQRELLNKGKEVTIKSIRNKMQGIEAPNFAVRNLRKFNPRSIYLRGESIRLTGQQAALPSSKPQCISDPSGNSRMVITSGLLIRHYFVRPPVCTHFMNCTNKSVGRQP